MTINTEVNGIQINSKDVSFKFYDSYYLLKKISWNLNNIKFEFYKIKDASNFKIKVKQYNIFPVQIEQYNQPTIFGRAAFRRCQKSIEFECNFIMD